MNPDQRQQFQKRFEERQKIFLAGVAGLTSTQATWQIYLDDQHFTSDGELVVMAVKNGQPSSDMNALNGYIRHITGQGFNLELIVDANEHFHVVSWELYEPDWPDELDPVLYLRWQIVTA